MVKESNFIIVALVLDMKKNDPYFVPRKNMTSHKYLEDIGLPRRACGTNFAPETRWMREEQEQYGFDRRDTYMLFDTFAQWLYERLRMYIDVAEKWIDLDRDMVILEGESMSMREAIQHILWPLEGYFRFKDVWSEQVNGERIGIDLLTLAAHRWADIAYHIWW